MRRRITLDGVAGGIGRVARDNKEEAMVHDGPQNPTEALLALLARFKEALAAVHTVLDGQGELIERLEARIAALEAERATHGQG